MIAYCVHYKAGKRLETDISLKRAAELAREGDGFVWVALREPSREELRDVGRAFGLSALGVEDEGARTRPRLEGIKGRGFLTMRGARYDESRARIEFSEIRVLVGSGYAISKTHGDPSHPSGARERLEELHPDLIGAGPGAVVWAILDQVVDG